MNANLDKEIAVTQIKAAGLMQRTKSVLALAELVSEFVQLTNIQQKQINALRAQLKAYDDEEENPQPASEPVSGAAPADAGRNNSPPCRPRGAGAEAVSGSKVERNPGEVPGD